MTPHYEDPTAEYDQYRAALDQKPGLSRGTLTSLFVIFLVLLSLLSLLGSLTGCAPTSSLAAHDSPVEHATPTVTTR